MEYLSGSGRTSSVRRRALGAVLEKGSRRVCSACKQRALLVAGITYKAAATAGSERAENVAVLLHRGSACSG